MILIGHSISIPCLQNIKMYIGYFAIAITYSYEIKLHLQEYNEVQLSEFQFGIKKNKS